MNTKHQTRFIEAITTLHTLSPTSCQVGLSSSLRNCRVFVFQDRQSYVQIHTRAGPSLDYRLQYVRKRYNWYNQGSYAFVIVTIAIKFYFPTGSFKCWMKNNRSGVIVAECLGNKKAISFHPKQAYYSNNLSATVSSEMLPSWQSHIHMRCEFEDHGSLTQAVKVPLANHWFIAFAYVKHVFINLSSNLSFLPSDQYLALSAQHW
jgi:hypothetical protein